MFTIGFKPVKSFLKKNTLCIRSYLIDSFIIARFRIRSFSFDSIRAIKEISSARSTRESGGAGEEKKGKLILES